MFVTKGKNKIQAYQKLCFVKILKGYLVEKIKETFDDTKWITLKFFFVLDSIVKTVFNLRLKFVKIKG